MVHVALLAVTLAEVPFVFEVVQRRVERVAGELLLEFPALCLMFLAVGIFDVGGVGKHRTRRFEPDLGHRLAEQRTILRLVDGFGLGADHLDIVTLQNAHAAQAERGVERGLAAHGGEKRVGPFLGDDLGNHFRRDRLDIGGVGKLRVGHDGGRVGVHQNDSVALFSQRFDGLGAGIVELAGLADDDGAGPDDQDRLDVGAFWHERSLARVSRRRTGGMPRAGRAKIVGLGAPYRQWAALTEPRK